MKKVLVFSHAAVLEVNRDLFYHLASGHEIDLRIVCPKFWRGDLIKNLPCQINTAFPSAEVIALPALGSGNGSLFFYRANLRREMGDWQPDIVFVDEEPWSLACLQIYLSFPKAQLIFYTKQNLKKILPPPFNFIQAFVFRKSAFCFSVSDEVSEVLRWKGFRGQIHYLPHSFDQDRFQPLLPNKKNRVREELGLNPAAVVVGYLGRLEPEKGIEDLCNAIIELRTRAPSLAIEFLFIGNGSLENSVRQFSEKYSRVVFREAIPHHQVGITLAAIDVLVLPSRTTKSWKEQFGRILVEAMACGVAVIGSDSGEIPHLIGRAGAGFTFREGDHSALAKCIENIVVGDKIKKFGKNGMEFAESTLTHERVAEDLGRMLNL